MICPLLRASHFQWPSMCSIDYCQCRPPLLFGGGVRIPSQKTTQRWFKSIEESLLASWQLHWVFRILPQAQKPYPGLTHFSWVSQKQNRRSQKARGFPRVMGSDGLGTFVSAGGTVCNAEFYGSGGDCYSDSTAAGHSSPFLLQKATCTPGSVPPSSSYEIQPVPNPSYSETCVTTSSDSSLKQW